MSEESYVVSPVPPRLCSAERGQLKKRPLRLQTAVAKHRRGPTSRGSAAAIGMALTGALSACGGGGTRTAVGTIRNAAAGCAESTVSYDLPSPYGGAGSLEIPPEWCGSLDGDMVCFLAKDNDSAFSGVQLARELGHAPIGAGEPSLDCWQSELEVWDQAWEQSDYHPVWDNE